MDEKFTGMSRSLSVGRPWLTPATRATVKYTPYPGHQMNFGATVA